MYAEPSTPVFGHEVVPVENPVAIPVNLGAVSRATDPRVVQEALRRYLMCPLRPDEERMVQDGRQHCKAFKTPQDWVGHIDTVRGPSICAVDLRGLLKVVPKHGAGDKGSQYCIDGFAIDRYCELLTERQQLFPESYKRTTFERTHKLTRAKLATVGYMVAAALPKNMPDGVKQVVLPLIDEHARHWLLLHADLQQRCFYVYDSSPPSRPKDKNERNLLLDRASTAVALALMQSHLYTDALTWERVHVDCPPQSNGHDCGVFVMVFMDLLSITGGMLCFSQADIRQLREKCLADLLAGRIRNFPMM